MTSQAEPAIIVKDVKKSFRIPLDKTSGIKQLVVNIFKRKKGYREFTALNGVSFEIKKGEFFGIVGRNGSGKSTLLKILAGVYTPDSGGVAVNGSLTPFIELGVGFNPELSGRENVFLNGALLGFSREEMEAMYDDIVDFAELHDFMEERLKNYSSGMQVRLAFSIAIRADTDILLLDEVLAVGDEAFQKKCYDYFESLKTKKKTVILVTHDMESVKRFCTRAALIKDGRVKKIGNANEVAQQYTVDNVNSKVMRQEDRVENPGRLGGDLKSLDVKIESAPILNHTDTLRFKVLYEVLKNTPVYVGISISQGTTSLIEDNSIDFKVTSESNQKCSFEYEMPLLNIGQGTYKISAAVFREEDRSLLAYTDTANSPEFVVENPKKKGGALRMKGVWRESKHG